MVSILARPFERALPWIAVARFGNFWFQSSPALSSGRYERANMQLAYGNVFQSSPALSSGRYSVGGPPGSWLHRFNPRPPFRAGATTCASSRRFIIWVSILARPFERALHFWGDITLPSNQFQSSPALSSGRYRLG